MTGCDPTAAYRAAELAARNSFSRLRALLAARWGDVAAAEDALADALQAALERWPAEGVPQNPEGWLMTVARNRLKDRARHHGVVDAAEEDLRAWIEDAHTLAPRTLPDERLKLLLVCTHPAIDTAVRVPLMLQVVVGLEVRRIASALLVSPEALMKRLTRAKTKIREARLPFSLPPSEEWPQRLPAILETLYGAFSLGWAPGSTDDARGALAAEALWLCRVTLHLLPGEPELEGLLALMLFSHARRGARECAGRFVPLAEQNPADWDAEAIAEAETLLRQAGARRRPGPYQLEAAIQAVHAARRQGGKTDWRVIHGLYQGLCALAPTLGAGIAAAVAQGEAGDWPGALAALQALQSPASQNFAPWWAALARTHEAMGAAADAALAYRRAAALSDDAALRQHLLGRAARLSH